tara:strand:+ start:1630 stop:1896 length:267 start_codon:yes stop_codon:yes gene_type:complete
VESLVGKLVKVNDSIVFLEDRHIGALGIVVSIIDQEEKYASFKKHPEIMKHLIREGKEKFYDKDVMFDILTAAGEKIRLFYNEFTIME